ncbi:MAG: helix-turn-helix domain-containing protein [Candidatus Thermoplasmatota archaeon]
MTYPRGGTLYAQVPPETTPGILADWLAPTAPLGVEYGANHVQRFHYAPLPPSWEHLFSGLAVEMLWLTPSGDAHVCVTGPRNMLQDFASRVKRTNGQLEVRHIGPAHSRASLLTGSQEAALRAAVASGYYRIPRPLNLHDLARQFGVTAASLSERLRRAEGRVLTRYVEGALTIGDQAPYVAPPPWPSTEPEWASEEAH